MPDRPGTLAGLLASLAETDANVLDVAHVRTDPRLRIDEVDVAVQIETKGTEHLDEVMTGLREAGYTFRQGELVMLTPRIAIVTARAAVGTDEDDPILLSALVETGALADVLPWDEESVDWSSYDIAVIRSTWDYPLRASGILDWARA